LGSSAILNASSVIPVAMAEENGLPSSRSTLGRTLGSRGLLAPGAGIPGAALRNEYRIASGSSYAASFVTGAFALLSCAFPRVRRETVAQSLLSSRGMRWIRSIVPPPLNASAAFRSLLEQEGGSA
jgi:hypothetical protein